MMRWRFSHGTWYEPTLRSDCGGFSWTRISDERLKLVLIHRPIYFPLSATACIYTVLPSSGQYRADRVTQLRTDSVRRGESAAAGPVVLKLARITRAAYSEIPWTV